MGDGWLEDTGFPAHFPHARAVLTGRWRARCIFAAADSNFSGLALAESMHSSCAAHAFGFTSAASAYIRSSVSYGVRRAALKPGG